MLSPKISIVCIECLESLESPLLQDLQNNPLCSSCAEKYYLACADCKLFAAKDELPAVDLETNEYLCSSCLTHIQPTFDSLSDEAIAHLVNEYLQLHGEEKRVKDELERVKEQLKQLATGQSENGAAVTFTGAEGAVKCSYKTSFKVVPDVVDALREVLEESDFNRFFTEKISFEVNKDFEINLAADLPDVLKQQIVHAVSRSESATINVVKK